MNEIERLSQMTNSTKKDRWRCLIKGCNPVLFGYEAQLAHKKETGHRTARWPVRSEYGKQQAAIRNRTGYYDKYNVGEKSAYARGLTDRIDYSEGSLCTDESGEDYWGDSVGE